MSRFLFIGPDHGTSVGGREQLSRLHRRALAELMGDRLDTILLPRSPLSGGSAISAVFSGRINGINQGALRRVAEHIGANEIDQVWLDGSNLGAIAEVLSRGSGGVRLTTFFHNIEARFFLGALRQQPSFRRVGIVGANFSAERMAVGASTQRVALNCRDSNLMKRLYGRGADHFLPMALPPNDPSQNQDLARPFRGDYLLFVGGAFYANQTGILWYAKHVAPHLTVPTLIVGRGLEALGPHLADVPNIMLIGAVDALDPYYRYAKAVVAPIFDGSGMKTKVAEAMMHGKRIIGTPEAFVGYEHLIASSGWQCTDAAEFVAAVHIATSCSLPTFDISLRLLFDEQFSYEATRRRIATIVGLPGFRGD